MKEKKLQQQGSSSVSVYLPKKEIAKMGWNVGDYVIVDADIEKRQIVIKKRSV